MKFPLGTIWVFPAPRSPNAGQGSHYYSPFMRKLVFKGAQFCCKTEVFYDLLGLKSRFWALRN